MERSATVNWAPVTIESWERKPLSLCAEVTNTLTTVATKSQALVFHVNGEVAASAVGSEAGSGEGVAEGFGESLELWGELGIQASEVGVYAERSAGKSGVGLDLEG